MSTSDYELHRAIVHSSNVLTGAAEVRIPSLLGAGQLVSIPTTGLTRTDGEMGDEWNVPAAGSSVFVAVSADRTQFLWMTALSTPTDGPTTFNGGIISNSEISSNSGISASNYIRLSSDYDAPFIALTRDGEGTAWIRKETGYVSISGLSDDETTVQDIVLDGKVGIGTDSPSVNLEVSGNGPIVRVTDANAVNSASGQINFMDGSSNTIGRVYVSGTSIRLDGTVSEVKLQTGATDRLTIDSVGNINLYSGDDDSASNLFETVLDSGRREWGSYAQTRHGVARSGMITGTAATITTTWDNSLSSASASGAWLTVLSKTLTLNDYRFGSTTVFQAYALWGFSCYTSAAGGVRSRILLDGTTYVQATSQQYHFCNASYDHQYFVGFDTVTFRQNQTSTTVEVQILGVGVTVNTDANDSAWVWMFVQ